LTVACFLAVVTLSTQETTFPTLDDSCYTVKWEEATEDNNWGNCVKMTTDNTHRYITANEVPDYYVNPYCPISIGRGYCTALEIANNKCVFTDLICGGPNYADNGEGSTPYGDVWVASKATYKIRLEGNPTQSDRPQSMYDASGVDAEKTSNAAAGVAINGIGILGPSDAGDLSIDGAGFQLACGGHVTPPLAGSSRSGSSKDQMQSDDFVGTTASSGEMGSTPSGGGGGGGPSGPPLYHYHKSPSCLLPFRNSAKEVSIGGTPYKHAELIGYAIDGFGIYGYQDVGGAAPIVDQCGGHFGPVDDTGDVVYHYHSRTSVPYHLGCQGPSLGKCSSTQQDADFCHPGCGYDVCVQPATDRRKLEGYLAKFDPTWLRNYTVNDFEIPKRRGGKAKRGAVLGRKFNQLTRKKFNELTK